MGRPLRITVGGIAYHVLNRGNGGMRLFENDGDYAAFEKILSEAVTRFGLRLCSYCLLPNHWHLVVWPEPGADGLLSQFMAWITLTHTQRWHAFRNTTGAGHVYQGRFRSFPIEGDEHFVSVARYVERNAMRANLVDRAEDWRWCSLWLRKNLLTQPDVPPLSQWPVEIPARWVATVNTPLSAVEEQAIRQSIARGRPYGSQRWIKKMARQLGLETTMRPPGRPRKEL